jgi:hypothetical protein
VTTMMMTAFLPLPSRLAEKATSDTRIGMSFIGETPRRLQHIESVALTEATPPQMYNHGNIDGAGSNKKPLATTSLAMMFLAPTTLRRLQHTESVTTLAARATLHMDDSHGGVAAGFMN